MLSPPPSSLIPRPNGVVDVGVLFPAGFPRQYALLCLGTQPEPLPLRVDWNFEQSVVSEVRPRVRVLCAFYSFICSIVDQFFD